MSDALPRRVARQSAHSTAFFGIRLVAQVLLAVALGRSLAPAAYGTYSLVGTTLAFASSILQLGVYQYVLREVPGRPGTHGVALFKSVLGIEVGLAALVTATALGVLWANSGVRGLLGSQLHDLVPSLLGCLLLGDILSTELLRYLAARAQIEQSNIVEFLQRALWPLLVYTVFATASRPVTLPLVFGLWGASQALAVGYGLWRVGVKDLWMAPMSLRVYLAAVRFGAPMMVTSLSAGILDWADRYFIVAYHSTGALGVYAFQYNIIRMVLSVSGPLIGNVLTPYIVSAVNTGDTLRGRALLSASLRYRLVSITPILIGLVFWSQTLVLLLARAEYAAVPGLMAALAPIPVLLVISATLEQSLILERRTLAIAKNYVLATILNLGLNFLLIPRHPYYGAAAATDLSLLALVLMLWYQQRTSPIRVDVPWGRIAMATMLATAAGFLLAHVLPQAVWGLAIGVIVAGSVYMGALGVLRAFPPGEIRAALGLGHRGIEYVRKPRLRVRRKDG